MKKLLIIALLFISISISAQEFGVRFGEVSGNNVAVDAMIDTGDKRIHANASFGDGVGLDAILHFINAPIG
ncbi:MAG: outer membrane insertion C- signal, partial [Bacteroidota bacterium]